MAAAVHHMTLGIARSARVGSRVSSRVAGGACLVAGDVDLELPGPPPVRAEAHEHTHRDVSGGWLRPSVFGAMDGLVTNVSLIAGVGGGGVGRHTLILTGMAGLVAGAFSMATG